MTGSQLRAPSVVIVGAGFGGLACARGLAGSRARVTVVDRHNFHTFLPLLYQVATAGLNSADVAYPVRGILRRDDNLDFRQGEVVGVDWDAHDLVLDAGPDGRPGVERLPFDHLVVAAGSQVRWFGVPGAAEHAQPLYTLADAAALRNHVLGCFEAAAADASLLDDGILTMVVVGGGPTGVETAGALAELVSHVLRKDFAHLDVGRARVVLLEQGGALLAAFHDASSRHALESLRARGVDVRTGTTVEAITGTCVRLSDGTEVATRTVVWAAGVQAAGLAGALGVETGPAGRIAVADDLSIPGHPGAWAIGDVADQPGLPQLAQVAIQGGHHAARMILRREAGEPTEAFRYHDKGIMATIGRRAAVVELPSGVRLRGEAAWVAWLGLHLVTLLGMRNRLSVLVNWAWNYVTWDRGPRLIFGHESRHVEGMADRTGGVALKR